MEEKDEKKSQNKQVRFPMGLHKWLEREAKRKGVSFNRAVVNLLSDGMRLSSEYKVSLGDLFPNDSAQFFDAKGRPYLPAKDDSVVMLPILRQRASAGPGQELIGDENYHRHLPVLASLISKYQREDLRVVEVRGDSMTGVHLNDGDLVVFAQGLVRQDGIYVITLSGDVMVKRLRFDSVARQIVIMSENPRYPQPQVVPSESELLRIEGKVVAWFHLHPY